MKNSFRAVIELIGINPFVFIPDEILQVIFTAAGRSRGHIPIRGNVNGRPYTQTLVKFSGAWRLYINAVMLDKSPRRVGEMIDITIEFDPSNRTIEPHPRLIHALDKNRKAKEIFENLSASKQNEIVRYISRLKTEESIVKNVRRAIDFLLGNGTFVGRERP